MLLGDEGDRFMSPSRKTTGYIEAGLHESPSLNSVFISNPSAKLSAVSTSKRSFANIDAQQAPTTAYNSPGAFSAPSFRLPSADRILRNRANAAAATFESMSMSTVDGSSRFGEDSAGRPSPSAGAGGRRQSWFKRARDAAGLMARAAIPEHVEPENEEQSSFLSTMLKAHLLRSVVLAKQLTDAGLDEEQILAQSTPIDAASLIGGIGSRRMQQRRSGEGSTSSTSSRPLTRRERNSLHL